ncbi:MAG: polysaccharide biosynthesis protein [Candidatus Eisenbacteria bacterium]|jgi:FlaA1/EpsC-like NDP-sugar epimerase|nr:polysaccharide biosynthesis protein [Candidatus Eisenbacteria bacterium]
MLLSRNRYFFILDLLLLPAAAVLAFVLRLDVGQLAGARKALGVFALVVVPIKLVVFYWMGLYGRLWRYASIDELVRIIGATGLASALGAAAVMGFAIHAWGVTSFPRSVPFIDALLTLVVAGGPRFAVRWLHRRGTVIAGGGRDRQVKRVLIAGAGDAGAMIVKEMRTRPRSGLVPVGFVDDDRAKHGILIHSTPVLGNRASIPELVEEYGIDEVIIAMPSASGSAIREVVRVCEKARVRTRIVPDLSDIIAGQVRVAQLREVQIEDLLRREPVRIDSSAVDAMVRGTRVLVTGAGGSIGSELCRQIAKSSPSLLALLGHGENSMFTTANEIARSWPDLSLHTAIGDARDAERLHHVFDRSRPQVVFHAAAHKHVPLMEHNVGEAVTNNILGTLNVLRTCERTGVERLVYISTDKAVCPSSVMGATKRVGELLVQDAARRLGRPYVAVRFGNVLGSRGSVVPVFRQQIARGGPVTVTHPEVTRYFMTIPEAVQLVLQAAAIGSPGEVILLEMGEPIKVADLARDLIELSGFEVGKDIQIEYTGLRPGEKLEEQLFVEQEEYVPTKHEKLFVLRNGTFPMLNGPALILAVEDLIATARGAADETIRQKLKEIVPEYQYERGER